MTADSPGSPNIFAANLSKQVEHRVRDQTGKLIVSLKAMRHLNMNLFRLRGMTLESISGDRLECDRPDRYIDGARDKACSFSPQHDQVSSIRNYLLRMVSDSL